MKSGSKPVAFLLLALVPALLCLGWTLFDTVPGPEPAALRQARGELPLAFSWERIASQGQGTRLAGFRLLYLALLRATDFGRFTVLNWALAAGVLAAVVTLFRRTTADRLLVASSLPVLSLLAFSPSFGGSWLLGSRLGLFVPPLALTLGAVWLTGHRPWRSVFFASLLAAQLAIFSDRTGVLVWLALAPVVWLEASRRDPERRWGHLALWLFLGNVGSILSYLSPWAATESLAPGLVQHLSRSPLPALGFAVGHAGWGLSPLTFDSETGRHLVGWIQILLLALCLGLSWRRRAEDDVLRSAMPWLALALFGFGKGLVACDAYFGQPLSPFLLRELSWGTLLLPIGLVGASSILLGRRTRPIWILGAFVLSIVLAVDGYRQIDTLRTQRSRLQSACAQLVFVDQARQRMPSQPAPAVLDRDLLLELRHAGLLQRLEPVSSLSLSELDIVRPESSAGTFASIDGGNRAHGHLQRGPDPPELVLVTGRIPGREESILEIAAPLFTQGDTAYSWTSDPLDGIEEGLEVRAWGFRFASRRVEPLSGTFVRRLGGFVSSGESP